MRSKKGNHPSSSLHKETPILSLRSMLTNIKKKTPEIQEKKNTNSAQLQSVSDPQFETIRTNRIHTPLKH